ncbi:hypothetical protein EBZ80_11930 [bacterium]|nr:hypothetical protein [bacterium]
MAPTLPKEHELQPGELPGKMRFFFNFDIRRDYAKVLTLCVRVQNGKILPRVKKRTTAKKTSASRRMSWSH